MQLNQKPIRRDPKKVLRESRFLPPGGTHTPLPFWEKFFLLKLFKKKKRKNTEYLFTFLFFLLTIHGHVRGKWMTAKEGHRSPLSSLSFINSKKQNTNFLGYFKLFSQLKK